MELIGAAWPWRPTFGPAANWVDDYAFFVQRYFRKYNRAEVETLHVGSVWWEADPMTNKT